MMASPVFNAVLFLLLSIWRVNGELIEAECVIEANSGKGNVAGTVYLSETTDEDVLIMLVLTAVGANTSQHGFHIHEYGNLSSQCSGAGGHYNPDSKDHGGKDATVRHVGDLGNIVADGDEGVTTWMTDGLVKLSGDQSVIGKAIVVHADPDDLGLGGESDSNTTGHAGARQGCCIITKTYPPAEPLAEDLKAKCEIKEDSGVSTYNVTGSVTLTYPKEHGETSIVVEMSGLKANSKHGFHIHQTGDLGEQCTKAEGHFNPYHLDHGAPNDQIRHVGDLGNVQSDDKGKVSVTIKDKLVRLSGTNSVLDRAIVVHADEDDLGQDGHEDSKTTGHAGQRIGCCIITKDESGSSGAIGKPLLAPGAICFALLTSLITSLRAL